MTALIEHALPKWSQMYTTGRPVTADQAKEILRRTDTYFWYGSGGNDRSFDSALASQLRMPIAEWNSPKEVDWQAFERWRERWGCIPTNYVNNSWISCGYIYGPHGWCWPDGRISYEDNVGKWPAVAAVKAEWEALVEAFPFLDLAATLMSDEGCVTPSPVVTLLARKGKVDIVEGSLKHHERFPALSFREHAAPIKFELPREHGPIPPAWFDEWAEMAARLYP